MERPDCETYNPCSWQTYRWIGTERLNGDTHNSSCNCPLDKICTYHRDNTNLRMYVFLCYPLTTTTNSTGAV
ncbi:hypothetical protein TNIN_68031 [Trichonephila inaurata madagascariensis]|uniref:Uncharacterized protein n=1 Tax=Trichonephila inaurata madagascariensis TaxID=2747483 RepID=A0A8X6KC93_9ARAC|nr:hypothetical protein TNIN_68031 [Trichonephila inaurata madagascariensis]